MRSFALARTNVALTANVKVVVSGAYSIYLESIDSEPALSSDRFKKFRLSKSDYYDEAIPSFFSGLPADTAFKVRNLDDKDIMFNTFENQYDDTYQAGCRNIYNNKSYDEEFECFAPLYLGRTLPTHFIIFRVDGPGAVNLGRDNFRAEILENLKCVRVFDLTKRSPLGEWLATNFTENPDRPAGPLYVSFRPMEFSSWNGIDYEVGGYASKSVMLDQVLEYENTFFDMEKFVLDGYRNNKVVFPDILNLSFLFDDTPATPDGLRKWSLNRYMGFYLDSLDLAYRYSPYALDPLREDVVVRPGNILRSAAGNPFTSDWDDSEPTYVEVSGSFYKVERYSRDTSPAETKVMVGDGSFSDEVVRGKEFFYKVVSDRDLSGLTHSAFNATTIKIESDAGGWYVTRNNGADLIPTYDTADVWVMRLGDSYHVVRKRSGKYYLNGDYGFELTADSLSYWVNRKDPTMTTRVPLDPSNPVVDASLFRLDFTSVRDFDTSIVDTEFSRYEYERELALTPTDQPKLYATDYSSAVNPRPLNEYYVQERLANVPCSSEYTANGETFRLVDGSLSDLWCKNPVHLKWCFEGSISANDYPYRLNNSFAADEYNQAPNPFQPVPSRADRNLDHFYTVNSSSPSYSFHSVHVESLTQSGNLDTAFAFDLPSYLSTGADYFTWFFGKTASFRGPDRVVQTRKWSSFQRGDRVTPNTTLFRGMGFDIQDVVDIKAPSGRIDSVNLANRNSYEGWKFSVLVSKNSHKVYASASSPSVGYLAPTSSGLSWYTLGEWRMGRTYEAGDLVTYQGIIWRALTQSTVTDPKVNPSNTNQWYFLDTTSTILSASQSVVWSPARTYAPNDYVAYGGDFYYYDPKGQGHSFWNPKRVYDQGDMVIYQGRVWSSTTASNFYQPGSSALRPDFATSEAPRYWEELAYTEDFYRTMSDWNQVELWSGSYIYGTNSVTKQGSRVTQLPGRPYSFWMGKLYQLVSGTASADPPSTSPAWARVYSMEPDTDFVYTTQSNPVIRMNNTHYVCRANPGFDTLESGVCVYIHRKWKNVLVNVYVNDNTLAALSNAGRDSLYTEKYANLTANNLINAVNDLSKRFGFSDNLMYVIVGEDGGLSTFDISNIESLPVLLTPRMPDEVFSRRGSLTRRAVGLQSSQIRAARSLERRGIQTAEMLNYYNGGPLATEISRVVGDPEIIPNYHGLKNQIYGLMWRYSGNYAPLTYEVPLFARPLSGGDGAGNYLFDTSLTEFGRLRQRVASKVNRRGSVLKLRGSGDLRSVYPMVDEFGYWVGDPFIFKSTWDLAFYAEVTDPGQSGEPVLVTNKIIKFE